MANPQDVHRMSRDIYNIKKQLQKARPEIPAGFTPGAVLFAASNGIINEDSSNLFWDDTNNRFYIGGNSATDMNGATRLFLRGTNAHVDGPHIGTYTTTDNYPVMHFLSWSHDNMEITFDGYFDTVAANWASSDSGSNYQIRKLADNFGVFYDSGNNQGDAIVWNEGIRLDTSGIFSSLGDIRAFGDFISRKASVDYTGYIFVPVTPITSTSFDGDSFSTTAKTLIDLSTAYSGVPANIKAVLMSVTIRDSGSAGTECILYLGPTNVATAGMTTNCPPLNDRFRRTEMVVQCNANGDIYYQIVASGAGTFDIFMYVHGYWI